MTRTNHDEPWQRPEHEDGAVETIPAASTAEHPVPIACSLGDLELGARAESLRRELFAGALERREIDAGYAFRFPGDEGWPERLIGFVRQERRCCSFFRIELAFEPGLGPIWLTLTGAEGVKQFMETAFIAADAG